MIRLLVLDVDGTMTDGGVYYDATGNGDEEVPPSRTAGLVLARTAGIRVMICTGRECEAVRRRAADLKITDVYQNVGKRRRSCAVLWLRTTTRGKKSPTAATI